MKKKSAKSVSWIALGGVVVAITQGGWAQRPYYLLPGVHPGYSLVNMRPSSMSSSGDNQTPNVGGMAWLPDGRLFIANMSSNSTGGDQAHLKSNSSVGSILSGIPGATSNASVTFTSAGSGYRMPSGAVALGDTIYVLDNMSGITRLTPNGSGGYVQSTVYAGLLSDSGTKKLAVPPKPAGTWGHRTWNGGMLYKDGYFYAAVGQGLISNNGATYFTDANMYRGKGTILKISKDGGTVDTLAGGVRNPVSMAWGPDSAMLYTDNQGSFMPASAMFHVKQGRFFGHPKSPYDNVLRTPPAIIFPYGLDANGGSASEPSVTAVATDMLTLREGIYKNQLLVGSNLTTGVNRVFLEKVGGELQGALFPFSQGFGLGAPSSAAGVLPNFRANVNRLSYGPDGHIYLGGGGTPGSGGRGAHGFSGGLPHGLARLVPTNDTAFEMKAIRSLGPTQMEVEFTMPVVSAAAGNFAVQYTGHLQGGAPNDQTYGAGRNSPSGTLTVTNVTLNEAKTRAVLTITGLQQRPVATIPGSEQDRRWGHVVQIRVTGIASVSNRPMWQDPASGRGGLVGWYTLNKFGPGEDVGPTAVARGDARDANRTGLRFKVQGAGVAVRSPVEEAWTMRTFDMQGRVLAVHAVEAGRYEFLVPATSMTRGVTLLEAKVSDGRRFTATVSSL